MKVCLQAGFPQSWFTARNWVYRGSSRVSQDGRIWSRMVPKMTPSRPSMDPRWDHVGPRWAQDGACLGFWKWFRGASCESAFADHFWSRFWMPSWPMLGPKTDKKFNFEGSKSVSKTRRILEPFLIHFGTIFTGLAKSKIRVSYGRVAFFLIFRCLNTRSNFASIWGGSWGGFGEGFGRQKRKNWCSRGIQK